MSEQIPPARENLVGVRQPPRTAVRHVGALIAVTVVAFVILLVRFAPNWLEYYRVFQSARAQAVDETQRVLIDEGFKTCTTVLRGVHVMRQVEDLAATVEDPNHKIVRWRLLFPALGHLLGLPGTVVLALAGVGCAVLLFTLCRIALRAGNSRASACGLAIVAGAAAPFFTSIAWLGYFDAWLVVALLVVAFAPSPAAVLAACLLGPWIDERMVIGLPLALVVQWAVLDPTAASFRSWFRRRALPPLAVISLFAVIRLQLGGSGGSQTVGDYVSEFVFNRSYPLPRILLGAWEGLRFGWPLLLYVGFAGWRSFGADRRRAVQLLAVCAVALATAAFGLVSALDLSRSMALLAPVVPLGWLLACRTPWWRRWRVPLVLAATTLLVPAHHVVSRFVIAVDNVWSTPYGVTETFNNIGAAFFNRKDIPRNEHEAEKWFRQAAQSGLPGAFANLALLYRDGHVVPKDPARAVELFLRAAEGGQAAAQCTVGHMYATGDGVPVDHAKALAWFRRSALQGYSMAEENLGTMHAQGLGVPPNAVEAIKWYRRAAAHGNAHAQTHLGDFYAVGRGVSKDAAKAVDWYLRAAHQGHARAQSNLGVMYANGTGVPRNNLEALAWFHLAAEGGDAAARELARLGEERLSPERRSLARQRSDELARSIMRP